MTSWELASSIVCHSCTSRRIIKSAKVAVEAPKSAAMSVCGSMDDAELEGNKAKQASAEGVLRCGSVVRSVRSRSLFMGMIQNDCFLCAQQCNHSKTHAFVS